MRSNWSWLALLGLGAFHGINPAMGWLFAVALGLQERSRRAVLRAIPPIAIGHVLAIGTVVTLLWMAKASLPARVLRYSAAATLFGFGLYKLIRSRHPVWVGMRVGFRDLILWSFLMASAHGAGLMLVPIILGATQEHIGSAAQVDYVAHAGHSGYTSPQQHMTSIGSQKYWLAAVGVHSAGYLIITALISLFVYEKLGLALLRRAWFNLDLLWILALIISGVLVFLL
jgi:hypothetical protein